MSLDEIEYGKKQSLPEYSLCKREILLSAFRAADQMSLFISTRQQHKRLESKQHLNEFKRYVCEVYAKIRQKILRFCSKKRDEEFLEIVKDLDAVILDGADLPVKRWFQIYFLMTTFNEKVLKITDTEQFSLPDPKKALVSGLTMG